MREILDVAFSSTISFSIYPVDGLSKHGQELLALWDLRDQLEYYNRHICSLCYTYPTEGLHSNGMYEHGHSHGVKFFQKEKVGSDASFQVYLEVRQKEIDRLKKVIDQQDTYYNKLRCFLEEKAGQPRFDELKVESDDYEEFIANGAGTVPEHLYNHQPEIDLRPTTPEEIESFNKYLRSYVVQIFHASRPHWLKEETYRGFRALPAMLVIQDQIKRAFNRDAAVKAEIHRIETQFQFPGLSNYIEFLYPYQISDLNKWQSAIFNAMTHGYQFDYRRKKLSVHEIQALIHVEQVVLYYKYLHILSTNVLYSSFQELFKDAVQNGKLGKILPKTYLIKEALYLHSFNGWLQTRKNWEYGDECAYQMHLTKNNFEDFIRAYTAEEQARKFLISETREGANEIYRQNHQRILEWFRVQSKATKKDCKEIQGLREGDLIIQDPDYSTTAEAFALLINYYAPQYMEWEKLSFIEKYKTWNTVTIQAEIEEIESFMANAEKSSLSDACSAFNKWGQDTDAFIFLRLKSGFYENLEVASYPSIGTLGNKEAHLYGRYFLFYDFLKTKLWSLKETASDASDLPHRTETTEQKGMVNTDDVVPEMLTIDLSGIRNNFDHVRIDDVYKHFHKGLVEKAYLTETELRTYLKAAFEHKHLPGQKFRFANAPKKKQIGRIFYQYYLQIASKPYRRRREYAALLGDYFEGYDTKTVLTNFNRY
jgi:hypothetical protein